LTTQNLKNSTKRRTLSELSDHDLQSIIDAQKEKIKKEDFKSIELVLERNKLAKLQQELDKRSAKQVRL
jgi:hypothetical protein